MPIGSITRGTTGTNRLRRVDRWMQTLPILRRTPDPLVVDLGYGASAVTTLELHARLARVRPDVEILGLEISPERVRIATEQLSAVRAGATTFATDAAVSFALGGFDVTLPAGRSPAVIRAFNVLRQYDESEVADAWSHMTSRLQPDGALVEGTCDEMGRVASWVTVGQDGRPQRLTLSLRLAELELPSIVAERLPKSLIHRNVTGEPVHELMTALDRAWLHNAPLSVYGPRQRWIATVTQIARTWPVESARSRSRLGELTVPWSAVAPA